MARRTWVGLIVIPRRKGAAGGTNLRGRTDSAGARGHHRWRFIPNARRSMATIGARGLSRQVVIEDEIATAPDEQAVAVRAVRILQIVDAPRKVSGVDKS